MADKSEKAQRRKAESFLKELDLLTEKYGLEIGGCRGCCGAPWVSVSGKKPVYLIDYLMYCKSCKGYGPAAAHENC